MGRWGWRRLLFALFISVWIVGCSITTDTAPTQSPTEYPRVTLTVRLPASNTPAATPSLPLATTLQSSQTPEASLTPVVHIVESGDTLLGIALDYGVDLETLRAANGNLDPRSLQIGQQLIIPPPQTGVSTAATPTPLALPLAPPICYETTTMNLVCLGRVENTLDQPVERTTVAVQLLRADGTLLAEQTANTEQAIIPPGQAAPYRVLFAVGWEEYSGVAAILRSADPAQKVDERFILPLIEDEDGLMEEGHYVVSATLHNADAQPAEALRIVVTLYGDRQRVVGYRVLQIANPLQGGASLPIQVDVIPQTAERDLTHTLYVEARRGS